MQNKSSFFVENKKFFLVLMIFILIALIQTIFDIELNTIGGYDFGSIELVSLNSMIFILLITIFSSLIYISVKKYNFIYSISSGIGFVFIWNVFAGLKMIYIIFFTTQLGIEHFFDIFKLIVIPFVSIYIGGIFGTIGALIGWLIRRYKK